VWWKYCPDKGGIFILINLLRVLELNFGLKSMEK
jgi:hypothetical protein